MKIYLVCVISIFSAIGLVHAGNSSTGGGAPFLVEVKPFTDPYRLQQAIDYLRENLETAYLPQQFKDAFLADLKALEKSETPKFYYVPGVTSFGYNRWGGDYQPKTDASNTIALVAVGAFTEFRPQAPIFFATPAMAFDYQGLAKTIAQEIPHHLNFGSKTSSCINNKKYTSHDEDFVNRLGENIFLGSETEKEVRYALEFIYSEHCAEKIQLLQIVSESHHKLYELFSKTEGHEKQTRIEDVMNKLRRFDVNRNQAYIDEMVSAKIWLEDELPKIYETLRLHPSRSF